VQPPKPTITLRRPTPPIPLSVAESFVRGESDPPPAARPAPANGHGAGPAADLLGRPDVQVAEHPDIQPLRPGIVQRRSGRVRRRTTVYLEPSLATRLAVYCATYGLEISQVAENAILDHLNSLERRPTRVQQEPGAAG
jgi:hypothetical protein